MEPSSVAHLQNSASPAPAVLRAGAILRTLAAANGSPLTIGQLASAIQAPRSSTMNVCAALISLEFISLSPNGYALGRGIAELAYNFFDNFAPVQRFLAACAMAPPLENTTQLATLDQGDVVYLARHDGAQLIRIASRIGGRLPASCTALGKAMLSTLPQDERERLLKGMPVPLPRMTDQSLGTAESLREAVEEAQHRGFAVDWEETTPGIVCVAVPLSSRQRASEAFAVSASILRVQADPDRVERTAETLRAVVARMGRG